MGAIQSDDLEYEMQVCLTLDMEHRIDISKTRASVLAGKSWQANHETEFAQLYKTWLEKGEAVIRQRDVDALQSVQFSTIFTDGDAKREFREAFKQQWGGTNFLTPDQLDDVWRWVFAAVPIEPHPFRSVGDDAPDWCSTCNTRSACRWHRSDAPDPIERDAPQTSQNATNGDAGSETADNPPAPASDDPGVSHEQPSAVDPAYQRDPSEEGPEHDGPEQDPSVEPPDVPRGTEPTPTSNDPELAERLATERVIFDEVKAMNLVEVKKGPAARRKQVTGGEATVRARFARELCIERLGADPFIAR
jgi:hypothetical protein